MKTTVPILAIAASAPLLAGCVAIPMGRERFTTEYPTDIRATWDSPTKTYEPSPAVSGGDEDHHAVAIGLQGAITSVQPQVQHYEKVTLEKRKYMGFGFFPSAAGMFAGSKNDLALTTLPYKGDGIYSTMPLRNPPKDKPHGSELAWNLGADAFSKLVVGLLNTPFSLLFGAFGPYEHDRHYMGRFLESEWKAGYTSRSYAKEDIDRLLKFSPEDRKRIGAWTFHEDAEHPQNTFRNSFSGFSLFGFYKFARYEVKKPEALPSKPVEPKVSVSHRTVQGPYAVTLRLPSLGYLETVALEPGAKEAEFLLVDAANGDAFADGTVAYSLPAEGLEAVRNADDRAILERAAAQEWPVRIALPAPRPGTPPAADGGPAPATSPAPAAGPLYSITSVEQDASGALVVRIAVHDLSKTFEIDRIVQPQVRRLLRDRVAPGESADRRENIQWKTEDEGKTLVYTASFE